MFASPRPGDAAFGKAFDERVFAYQVWNYELDAVPRVPFGPDYAALPKINWIGLHQAQTRIRFDLGCNHHIFSYAAMLNYTVLDWLKLPAMDSGCAACIKGPISGLATGAL